MIRAALTVALAAVALCPAAAVAYPQLSDVPSGFSGQVADTPIDPALRGQIFAYIKSDILPQRGIWRVRCGPADFVTYCRARSPQAKYARRITVITCGPLMLADQTWIREDVDTRRGHGGTP